MIKKEKIVFLSIIIVVAILIGLIYYGYRKEALKAVEVVKIEQHEKAKTIKIHIIGEVNNPGLYDLPVGSIAQDAVQAAGGFTAFADETYNLAKPLRNGSQVEIKKIKDTDNIEKTVKTEKNTTENLSVKININSAPKEELLKLPSVGDVTAEAIIKYREKNGNFKKTEDIMKVSRIGKKTFEQFKDYITVK